MTKNNLLIRANVRKSLKQIIAVCLLIMLSSWLINCVLILVDDYKDNYYRKQKELNCATINYLYVNPFNIDLTESLNNLLSAEQQIDSYEIDQTASGYGTADFNDGILSSVITAISLNDTQNKKLNKYEIIDSIEGEGVYISYLFYSGGNLNLGDNVNVSINGKDYTWKIVGFYNALDTGTVNCLDITCILTDNLYHTVKSDNVSAYKLCIKVKEGVNAEEYCNALNNTVGAKYKSLILIDSQAFDDVYSQRYTNATIFQAILISSTVIMTLVMMFIIAISLNNYINNNISTYGTFKAMGYKSSQLINPLLLEFATMCVIMSVVGIAFSYLAFPFVNNALESQIGIPYQIRFILLPTLLTIAISLALVVATTYLSVKKIKTIPAISAIRQDKTPNNKNTKTVNLVKTKLHVNTAIGLKSCFGNISRSMVILLSLVGVSFLSGLSIYLSQNVLGDPQAVLSLICGQTPDSIIGVNTTNKQLLVDTLKNNDDVQDYYLYSMQTVTPDNHSKINAYVVENCNYINDDVCIEGTLPQNADEVAVNKAYAIKNDITVGDYFAVNGHNFVVCGFIQGAYYAGQDCYLLLDGYNRYVSQLTNFNYYVDLKGSVDIDAFNKYIINTVHPTLVVNQNSYLTSLANMYSTILSVLVVIIVLLSILIIAFVLYVVLSIVLENKKKEHGILKSIGFVSKEIIYQTVVSILPCCLLGILIGLFLSGEFSNEIVVMSLTSMGIFRFGSKPNPLYLLLCGITLIVFIVLYTIMLSRSIRKIAPHDLFNRE